jgi:TM2 domain-containing membrane protein YozV
MRRERKVTIRDKVNPMEVNCPHCQAILTVHPSEAGSLSDCPKCTGKFHIPVPMARPRDPSARGVSGSNEYEVDQEYRDFVGKKVPAGICGILLGSLGIHKFILGLSNAGIIMLVVTLSCVVLTPCLIVPILGLMSMQVIGLIEGIIYLTMPDDAFYQTYGVERKEWF